jgi:hypothetical protein
MCRHISHDMEVEIRTYGVEVRMRVSVEAKLAGTQTRGS